MALDICFDVKTFLECTCRACSRYFGNDDGQMIFHQIYADAAGVAKVEADVDEKPDSPLASEAIKEIFDEFLIWKLNIQPNDGLPQQICHECLGRFRSVKIFREECLDTQKVLLSYFKDFDSLLECASLGRLSPKSESVKSMPGTSPASFNADDLVEEVPDSPGQQQHQQQLSPCGSPKFRMSPGLSPKFQDTMYAESSLGTPPPLFEEIKTEPIDVQTMEYIKAESELQPDLQTKTDLQTVENDLAVASPYRKTPPAFHFSSSDDESSTPSSDEENDTASDTDAESEPNYRHNTDARYNPRNPLQCKICFVVFPKRSLLKEHHLRAHPHPKPYICNICSSAFKSNFLLTQHKLKHNRPDSIKCELCTKYFRSQLHLQRHTKNFHLTSTYTCHICHEKFENYTQIRFQYHVRQHGEKRFHCQFCEKSFHQKIHLINHERTHTKEQPFRCDICGKAYRQQTACQEHMLTHKDPTPFKCKICEKGFTQRSTLRLHYRTHSSSMTFNCALCGQSFAQKVHYEVHQLTHSSDVPSKKRAAHTCGYCGKAFALESSLKTHMKTHAQSLKPLKCKYCDKSFQNKQIQLLHEQQHKKVTAQRFQCSFCNETFTYRSTLGQHMLSHLESENCDYDDFMNYSFNTSI